jgi:hypothetical protein
MQSCPLPEDVEEMAQRRLKSEAELRGREGRFGIGKGGQWPG